VVLRKVAGLAYEDLVLVLAEQMATQTESKATESKAIQAARACIAWKVGHDPHRPVEYTIEGGLKLLPPPHDGQGSLKVATLLYYFNNLPHPAPAAKPTFKRCPRLTKVVLKRCEKIGVDVSTVKAKIADLEVVELKPDVGKGGDIVFKVSTLRTFKCTSSTSFAGISVELETFKHPDPHFSCQSVEIHWEWVLRESPGKK
jgi:hypothetical protein